MKAIFVARKLFAVYLMSSAVLSPVNSVGASLSASGR
jgi:hypothetical protein